MTGDSSPAAARENGLRGSNTVLSAATNESTDIAVGSGRQVRTRAAHPVGNTLALKSLAFIAMQLIIMRICLL